MFHFDCLIASFFGILIFPTIVAARFCEGGHICSLPRECCTQGCCPPYQSGPRQLPPATDHVLNLFFINHWYFWFLIVAVILAILCVYSLWKKRRTLCGWNFSEHHTQSEGDSAGSCYAPPQYSRCNSFHHPPPPYTEVTSKPDLYPLVFTCNSDNGKTGASYLMVQYFRNYIVRPAGSLSATSTVDSLSSSFICNANEANTLVPPPYSRAASPDIGINVHYQQHYRLPRSASQLVCSDDTGNAQIQTRNFTPPIVGHTNSQLYGAGVVNEYDGNTSSSRGFVLNQNPEMHPLSQMRISESVNFQNIDLDSNVSNRPNAFITSQSDQQFRYIENSNSSISDIFVNNTYSGVNGNCLDQNSSSVHHAQCNNTNNNLTNTNNVSNGMHYNINNSNSNSNRNPNNGTNTTNNAVYNSCGSIGGVSITVPVENDGNNSYPDLNDLRRSVDKCYQLLHRKQMPSASLSEDSPNVLNMTKSYDNSGLRRYEYATSTCSAVSSLANIGSPISPPQATSPTDEVKEILDQIRQLQSDNGSHIKPTEQFLTPTPRSPGTLSKVVPTVNQAQLGTTKRPSTLSHSTAKKKFFSKTNKTLYTPMTCTSNVRNSIKSPVLTATSFLNRGRKGWISRSAPTTPGTGLPSNRLGDDSPLLNEHDEDQDQDQDQDQDSVQNV